MSKYIEYIEGARDGFGICTVVVMVLAALFMGMHEIMISAVFAFMTFLCTFLFGMFTMIVDKHYLNPKEEA